MGVNLQDRTTIYTDGAARGNPGPSASGYMIYDNKGVIRKHFVYNGEATNNYAEYNAIILALEWCMDNLDISRTGIKLYSDSELVIRQVNGSYKVRSRKLMGMNRAIKALMPKFKELTFRNTRRENRYISMVDRQLNILLDKMAARKGQERHKYLNNSQDIIEIR